MKVLVAILSLVGTMSLQQEVEKAYYEFTEIERYWTISPKNKVLFTRNQSEPTQDIQLKEVIDDGHQLLVSAEVTNTDRKEKVYRGEYLKICIEDHYGTDTWDLFAIRLFKTTILPQEGWAKCPIQPKRYKIHRWTNPRILFFPYQLADGHYEISYTVKSTDGETVFSPLKYKFVSTNITPKPRCC